VKRIDDGGIDGDLCALLSAPNGYVAIVWPTAEKLKTIAKLAEVGHLSYCTIIII
jgi:hypothetical protein